jgi:hypothetical protein
LTFYKEHSAFRVSSCVFDVLEGLQGGGRKIAEDMFGPHFARQAILDDVQPVR